AASQRLEIQARRASEWVRGGLASEIQTHSLARRACISSLWLAAKMFTAVGLTNLTDQPFARQQVAVIVVAEPLLIAPQTACRHPDVAGLSRAVQFGAKSCGNRHGSGEPGYGKSKKSQRLRVMTA
ncbi:MAG: hypothetical protein NTY19_17185, partial [Planctomycetota bacterium]|nr:hypothetical protein [Planctomycetota bacterium]